MSMNTLNYTNFYQGGSIECENLVIVCVDFRFRKQLTDLLSYAGYREFDLIAMPGASRSIIDSGSREAICGAITTCSRLHNTRRLIVIDHVDCGAYGGSVAFNSLDAEEAFHAARLQEASGILTERFPGMEIVTAYIDWLQLKTIGG